MRVECVCVRVECLVVYCDMLLSFVVKRVVSTAHAREAFKHKHKESSRGELLIVVEGFHRDFSLSVGLANAKSKCRKETLCFRCRFSLVSVCESSVCVVFVTERVGR